MGKNNRKKEYEASLKSIETENYLDRIFYRPIGFQIARLLRNTGITPNQITILSIFVGVAAGILFYYPDMKLTLIGISLLIFANILDCVDGQLARLTGIKSEIGRILDGLAGDFWFTAIYVALAWRLMNIYGTGWFFLLAVMSGISHLVQANITDYYKTLHLFFIDKEKGKEFQSLEAVKEQQQNMPSGINKFFFRLYIGYTTLQIRLTPNLQKLLTHIRNTYGDDIPEEMRLRFRKKSNRLMKRYLDMMTFNGRTVVLFIFLLTGYIWLYFLYEIVVLNTILCISIRKYETLSLELLNEDVSSYQKNSH